MSKPLTWFLVAVLGLNFGACVLLSYLGTGVATAAQRYPRVVQTESSKSKTLFIRSGSTGGGSSIQGGGPSSGK